MSRAENIEHANRALECLKLWDNTSEDIEAGISDILADLMHYCQQYDLEFEDFLSSARHHFECELEEARRDMPSGCILTSPEEVLI